jgi:hypothetical protein
MDIDTDKIDEAVLALLYLSLHDQFRAWKGHDWGALDRVSTAETNCASWRRESVPVGLGEKGREALRGGRVGLNSVSVPIDGFPANYLH